MNAPTPVRLALMCRAGFEPDLVAELEAWVRGLGGSSNSGSLAVLVNTPGLILVELPSVPGLAELVFARDLLVVHHDLRELDTKNRFGPIETALEQLGPQRAIQVLTADSDAGKPLAPLVKALESRVASRVQASAQSSAGVWLVSGNHALVGLSPKSGGALFPGGVARLRFPRDAPSRSTLKLDEAFLLLLSEAERTQLLRPGLRAVDLGAAPGGWTYQLTRRGLRVIAVDNGRMDAALLATGQVEHLREDGFRYRPRQPVDWLVCDMVEKPAKVIDLVVRWFLDGHCRAAVFNLKLPMKKRFDAWAQARTALQPVLDRGFRVRARQLYHDREEITVALLPTHKVKATQTKPAKVKVQNPPGGRISRRRP